MAASNSHHGHQHHEHKDPGAFYSRPWVQKQLVIIEQNLRKDASWLGLDSQHPQRVLDYACGNGTVSKALYSLAHPETTFQGLDISQAQVDRYNAAAAELEPRSSRSEPRTNPRMHAVQADLSSHADRARLQASAEGKSQWKNFDIVITSMALHHFEDPVAMLKELAERARPPPSSPIPSDTETSTTIRSGDSSRDSGVVVVVEFCSAETLAELEAQRISNPLLESNTAYEKAELDASTRIEVTNNGSSEKIWNGFTPGKLAALMREAGCGVGLETRVHAESFLVPRPRPDHAHGQAHSHGATGEGKVGDEGVKNSVAKQQPDEQWVEMKMVVARGAMSGGNASKYLEKSTAN